jgi:hypothetical protein
MNEASSPAGGKKYNGMIKGLVAGPMKDAVYRWMIDDFKDHQRKFAKLGLSLTYSDCNSCAEINDSCDQVCPDIVFMTFDWLAKAEDCVDYLQKIYHAPNRPIIVYLDTYDQTTSPYFSILPYVDRYWKKQIINPPSLYNTNDWAGENPLSDMAVRYSGVDLKGWCFGSPLPIECKDRLEVCWYIGAWRSLSRRARNGLFDRALRLRESNKTIDIFCRVSVLPFKDADPDNIYSVHRRQCLASLAPLERKFVVASNRDDSRVSLKEFNRQLRSSKIAVSPWGWGEITDRDFRIVNARALLMKPDMSHLQTEPNIYVAHETYVPIKWDLSDIVEKCEYYLARPREIKRITENAFSAYQSFFKEKYIENKLRHLLDDYFYGELSHQTL